MRRKKGGGVLVLMGGCGGGFQYIYLWRHAINIYVENILSVRGILPTGLSRRALSPRFHVFNIYINIYKINI